LLLKDIYHAITDNLLQCLYSTNFARTIDGALIPCSSTHPMAQKMRMLDRDFDCSALRVPLVNLNDAKATLDLVHSSVAASELGALKDFAKEFGDDIELFEEEQVTQSDIALVVHEAWAKLSPDYQQSWIEAAKVGVMSVLKFVRQKATLIMN
jgi:Vps4 C terminal oligomerisation domain